MKTSTLLSVVVPIGLTTAAATAASFTSKPVCNPGATTRICLKEAIIPIDGGGYRVNDTLWDACFVRHGCPIDEDLRLGDDDLPGLQQPGSTMNTASVVPQSAAAAAPAPASEVSAPDNNDIDHTRNGNDNKQCWEAVLDCMVDCLDIWVDGACQQECCAKIECPVLCEGPQPPAAH